MNRTGFALVGRALLGCGISLGLTLGHSMVSPAWSADPFRSGETARDLGPEVEVAFEAFFCSGEYQNSREKLEAAQQASPEEPMVYALLAALAYQSQDQEAFAQLATRTREVATELEATDPLRGNLYEGVGYGLEAANIVLENGVVLGLPKAVPTLNNLFASIREARQIDPDDPELNLLNGYMDLLLTYRDRSLEQFQKAGPDYLAYRGQALAYRDLKQYPEALEAVDEAIAVSCDNPELYYLKAQLLAAQEQYAAAVPLFDQALAAADQLPEGLVADIQVERDRAAERSLTSSNGSVSP